MDPVNLRAIERIVAVAIGGLSIFLGYRLFLNMPEQKEGTGKFHLPGGISIYLSRVGPGVFFALFGAIVVAVSFHYAITYRETSETPPAKTDSAITGSAGTQTKSYSGLGGSGSIEEEKLRLYRIQVHQDIVYVNSTLPSLLKPNLSQERRNDVAALLPRVKLAMIKTVWNPTWGNFDDFRNWVEHGALGPPPKDMDEPAGYYREGLRGKR